MRHNRHIRLRAALLLLLAFSSCARDPLPPVKEGDIIFQTTNSKQSGAILLATHSQYSHVGLVLMHGGTLEIFEAVGPVKYTPIDEWILHGRERKFAVLRLRDSTRLLGLPLSRMETVAATFLGKPYDLAFDWSEDKMYCSEAVWKVFDQGAGVQLCTPAPMRSFDLSSPKVQRILRERYGDRIPYDEPMVSPEQLYSSPLFYIVCQK